MSDERPNPGIPAFEVGDRISIGSTGATAHAFLKIGATGSVVTRCRIPLAQPHVVRAAANAALCFKCFEVRRA